MQKIDINAILWQIAQIDDEATRQVEWQKASLQIATYLAGNDKELLRVKINELYTQIEQGLNELDKSIQNDLIVN